jgi:hypothetical protein
MQILSFAISRKNEILLNAYSLSFSHQVSGIRWTWWIITILRFYCWPKPIYFDADDRKSIFSLLWGTIAAASSSHDTRNEEKINRLQLHQWLTKRLALGFLGILLFWNLSWTIEERRETTTVHIRLKDQWKDIRWFLHILFYHSNKPIALFVV